MSNASSCSACGSLIEPDCDFRTTCGGVPRPPLKQTTPQPLDYAAAYTSSVAGQGSLPQPVTAPAMPGLQAAYISAPGQMKYALWADRRV
jgi:hypothetical protein